MKKFKIISFLMLAILFGAALIFFIVSHFNMSGKYVQVKNAFKTGVSNFIGSQTTARVDSIKSEIGAKVTKGQVLMVLDSSELKKEIDALQDQLKLLENSLQVKKGLYHEANKIINFQTKKNDYMKSIKMNNIDTNKKLLDIAYDKYKTLKECYQNGISSRLDLKKAEDELENAKNKYDVAVLDKNQFDSYDKSAADEGIFLTSDRVVVSRQELEFQIKEITNEIEVQKEKIARATKEIEKYIVKSPYNGIVDTILANTGEVVQTGQKLIILSLPGPDWIEAYVNENNIEAIDVGAKALIIFKAFPKLTFSGKVSYISKVGEINPNSLNSNLSKNELLSNDNSPGYVSNTDKYVKIKVDFFNKRINLPNGISATLMIKKRR